MAYRCSFAGPLKRDSHMLKENVSQCEMLVTKGIRRMSCSMKILPTKINFFQESVAEQDDHKISSYITTQSLLLTEQLSLS